MRYLVTLFVLAVSIGCANIGQKSKMEVIFHHADPSNHGYWLAVTEQKQPTDANGQKTEPSATLTLWYCHANNIAEPVCIPAYFTACPQKGRCMLNDTAIGTREFPSSSPNPAPSSVENTTPTPHLLPIP